MGVGWQRLPPLFRLLRRSVQGILQPLVRHAQNAPGRCLGDALTFDSRGLPKLLHSGSPRYLGGIPDLHAGIVKIVIVTPALPTETSGNSITANRWARILRTLGHQVSITTEWNNADCDALIALHARRSHSSIERFWRTYPGRPLIVALTGTDLYSDLPTSAEALHSLSIATRVVA